MSALYFLRPVGCPAGVDPLAWREALAERIEQHQEAMQLLIAALDAMDGDPDLEPSIIGGVNIDDGQLVDIMDDREGDDVLDLGEWSLGWTASMKQDGRNWLGNTFGEPDREAEHDGREPEFGT